MTSDYKYDIQMIAEELAEERFGRDFYDLPSDQQYALYNEATREWSERVISRAERD